jgi:hypothetical protein
MPQQKIHPPASSAILNLQPHVSWSAVLANMVPAFLVISFRDEIVHFIDQLGLYLSCLVLLFMVVQTSALYSLLLELLNEVVNVIHGFIGSDDTLGYLVEGTALTIE